MRLIDADRLKKELREFLVKDNYVNNPSTTYLDVLDVVDEQTTAYDIDKVMEELESIECASGAYERKCWLDKAIEIVKQGAR